MVEQSGSGKVGYTGNQISSVFRLGQGTLTYRMLAWTCHVHSKKTDPRIG